MNENDREALFDALIVVVVSVVLLISVGCGRVPTEPAEAGVAASSGRPAPPEPYFDIIVDQGAESDYYVADGPQSSLYWPEVPHPPYKVAEIEASSVPGSDATVILWLEDDGESWTEAVTASLQEYKAGVWRGSCYHRVGTNPPIYYGEMQLAITGSR